MIKDFICDYAKASPLMLSINIETKFIGVFVSWNDINDDKFCLTVFDISPENETALMKFIQPYLFS